MSKAAVANFLVRVNAFAPFRFLNRSKLLVLMYHRFSRGEEIGRTSSLTFEAHLKYLTRHYNVLSMTDASECIRKGVAFPRRSAVITIDDGYRDFYDIAFPILKNYQVPATIYVVTDFVGGRGWIWTDKARYILGKTASERLDVQIDGKKFDKEPGDPRSRLITAGALNSELKKLADQEKENYLGELALAAKVSVPELPPDEYSAFNWDQAREMSAAGIEIGSHTATHPILTNVDDRRLERELEDSKAAIQSEIGSDAPHFCYPNGDVSERERDAAASAGYASAVTTEIKLCENSADNFLIPRIDAEPEIHRFVQATSGFDRLKSR